MTRTQEHQKVALSHLWYEVWMLQQTSGVLSRGLGLLDFNIVLESFLIHSRNRIDFLNDQKFPSDIKCSDFGVNAINTPLSADIQTRINKWTSHLTWERVEGEKPNWPSPLIKEIVVAICGGVREFITNTPDALYPIARYDKSKQEFLELATPAQSARE